MTTHRRKPAKFNTKLGNIKSTNYYNTALLQVHVTYQTQSLRPNVQAVIMELSQQNSLLSLSKQESLREFYRGHMEG